MVRFIAKGPLPEGEKDMKLKDRTNTTDTSEKTNDLTLSKCFSHFHTIPDPEKIVHNLYGKGRGERHYSLFLPA